MGSKGSLRHLESSSTTESIGSNHQKERLERSSLEDCHSSSHYSNKLAERKRPGVSAIRDFPPSCGRSVHLRSSAGTSGVTREHHVTAVRDFPPQCGRSASLEARNFDQVQSDKVEKSPPSSNTAKTNVQKPGAVPGVKPLYDSWRRGKVAHRSKPTEGSITIKKQPERNLQPAERSEGKKSNNNGGKTTRFGDAAGLHDNNTSLIRNKVTETLCRFKELCIEIERKKSREGGTSTRRIDYEAARMLKKERGYVNTGKQIMGDVPGVEIGDKFRYRVELTIVGLHRQTEGGIDYAYFGGEALATSIVASGAYADDLHDLNSFTYTGHGGNVTHQRLPEHQELKRGNLAMKNSLDAKSPVRVICSRESSGARDKRYMYVGLYLVEDLWKEMGAYGKFVYKFRLRRIEGQGSIAW